MADSEEHIARLNDAFVSLKIKDTKVVSCSIKGPLQRFFVEPGPGVQVSKIEKYSQEIAMSMRAIGSPLIMPSRSSDGRLDGTVRIDIMTDEHPLIKFDLLAKDIGFDSEATLHSMNIPLCLGVEDMDKAVVVDLQKIPHLLVAGVTGSGKSVALHAMIRSIQLHSATHGIRLALIDPKLVEFGVYERSRTLRKALRYSIANCLEGSIEVIDDLEKTMQARLERLARKGCRDILEYRAQGGEMSFIVLIIDELADLVRDKKSGFNSKLCSLAAKSRAAGIHIIAATQHPSRDVITGLLKAQFPAALALRVGSQVHSRVVLDANGAESLQGKGDALLKEASGKLTRFRSAFVDTSKLIKNKKKKPGLAGLFLKR